MTKDEIFKMKQADIIGALNLALIVIPGDTDLDTLREHTKRTVDMLLKDIEVIDAVDEFLRLQELIIGDDT